MKENWMNELIELLNEYDDWMVSWYEEYFPTEWLFVTNAGQWFREEFILGKRYWFIQWLVQNDKIDFIKLIQKQGNWEIDNIKLNPIKELEYYKLLMLLAISENPISDLISYLK